MKLFLTNEKFMPSIGTFQFEPLNKESVKTLAQFSVKHEYFVNLIQDEIESYKLAKYLDTTIPLFSLTWNVDMYNNWDFEKDIDKNLFDNKIIMPTDRIIISEKISDDDYRFLLGNFFGGPFPEDIGSYLFECHIKPHNKMMDIKNFLKACCNNAMDYHNEYSKVSDGIEKLNLGTPQQFAENFDPDKLKDIIIEDEED